MYKSFAIITISKISNHFLMEWLNLLIIAVLSNKLVFWFFKLHEFTGKCFEWHWNLDSTLKKPVMVCSNNKVLIKEPQTGGILYSIRHHWHNYYFSLYHFYKSIIFKLSEIMRWNNFTERLFKIIFYLVYCQQSQHFLTGTFFEHLIQIKLRRSICQIHILFH